MFRVSLALVLLFSFVFADTIETNAINQATRIISLINSQQCSSLAGAFVGGNNANVMSNNQTLTPIGLCVSAVAAYDNFFIDYVPENMVVARELNTVIGPCTFRGTINGSPVFSYPFIISVQVELSDKPKNLAPQATSARIYYDTEFKQPHLLVPNENFLDLPSAPGEPGYDSEYTPNEVKLYKRQQRVLEKAVAAEEKFEIEEQLKRCVMRSGSLWNAERQCADLVDQYTRRLRSSKQFGQDLKSVVNYDVLDSDWDGVSSTIYTPAAKQ